MKDTKSLPSQNKTDTAPLIANNNHKSKEGLHYYGHRARLREKFLKSSEGSFSDYEMLEMLLFLAKPRGDVKPLAKTLIAKYGSLINVIHADKEQLKKEHNVGLSVVACIKMIEDLVSRVLRHKIKDKVILNSWNSLIDYLKFNMGAKPLESSRILYLNKKNILIADELQDYGTIDQTPLYPREVVKRALYHEASAIILVHNHPSGDPTPSKGDILMTKKIVESCKMFDIIVHDHVVVSSNDIFSFKSNLLL